MNSARVPLPFLVEQEQVLTMMYYVPGTVQEYYNYYFIHTSLRKMLPLFQI